MRLRSALPLGAAVAALLCATSACGSNVAQHSEANYCATVKAHIIDLSAPNVATTADAARVLGVWRQVASTAPLQVGTEWDQMVALMQAASTVDATNQKAVQQLAETARLAKPAADTVITYTAKKCGVTIGDAKALTISPVVTTSVPPRTSAPTTTVTP